METLNINLENKQPHPYAPPFYSLTDGQSHHAYVADTALNYQHGTTQQQQRPLTAHPETSNVIVVNGTTPTAMGHQAQRLTCPHCHVKMMTRLDYHATHRTHLFALLFCLTGLICCAPVPYFLKSCKSLDHYCSSCNEFIGNTTM